MSRSTVGAAVAIAALLASGCHTMRFEVGDGPVGDVVHDRKTFWLAGLTPTKYVDVMDYCPNGAVAVGEETTFLDGFFTVLTLSIYTPRSSTYYCAADAR